jgi:DNA repair exonuclease SbcCD nuclease subunit
VTESVVVTSPLTLLASNLLLAFSLLVAGCGADDGFDPTRTDAGVHADALPSPPQCDPAGPPTKATVVVLPDTQYYSHYFPSTFSAQTTWILQEQVPRRLAAVLHVGDLVDDPFEIPEWNVAGQAMRLLDGRIPYVLVAGNHDIGSDRSSPINDYFSPDSMPWITGTMTVGQIDNNYALVDIGPRTWLVVGLEYGPRDAVVAWADTVFKSYADRPAILLTHGYLDGSSGTRYSSPDQPFYPLGYTPEQGINDGEMLWQKLVVPNPNVRLVLCGHYGVTRQTSARPDGTLVHEIDSDYQWWNGDWNGYGYLRLMEFDYEAKEIRVETYSPTLDSYLTDDLNKFTLSLEL